MGHQSSRSARTWIICQILGAVWSCMTKALPNAVNDKMSACSSYVRKEEPVSELL